MRDFNFSHFKSILNGTHFNWLPLNYVGHLVHNLHARHIAEDLATRDNHILADIGVYRGEVEHASHVDISHDALEELEAARSHHDDKPEG
jgi:hypothetical protein